MKRALQELYDVSCHNHCPNTACSDSTSSLSTSFKGFIDVLLSATCTLYDAMLGKYSLYGDVNR